MRDDPPANWRELWNGEFEAGQIHPYFLPKRKGTAHVATFPPTFEIRHDTLELFVEAASRPWERRN